MTDNSLPPVNPYQSPEAVSEPPPPEYPENRGAALFRFRQTELILAVPTLLNLAFFHFHFPGQNFVPYNSPSACLGNLVALLLLGIWLWLSGLGFLDRLANLFYRVFGGPVNPQAWLASMYDSLSLMPVCAFGGAVVWVIWLYLLYFTDASQVLICTTAAILGHLLGACVYGRVFLGWYKARSSGLAQKNPLA